MMIRCPVHGDSLGVLVSPDIAQSISRGVLPNHERFAYTIDGTEVMWFVLSSEFLAKNGIPHPHSIPIPDDYPPWTTGLQMVCIPCLRNIDGSLPQE